jgi:hypothetical protein
MDSAKFMPFATLAARPVGSKGPAATPVASLGGLPAPKPMPKAMGGAGAPSLVVSEKKERKPAGRPTKEQRKLEKRMEIMGGIDDLLDNKPTKGKIRIYLLTRIQQLLEEKGITTS